MLSPTEHIEHTAGGICQSLGIVQPLRTAFADAEHMGRHGEQILNLLPLYGKIKADGYRHDPLKTRQFRDSILFLMSQGIVNDAFIY